MYSTSCPKEMYPLDDKYERGENILGMMRIGRLPEGGSYLHVFDQSDLKTSAWT